MWIGRVPFHARLKFDRDILAVNQRTNQTTELGSTKITGKRLKNTTRNFSRNTMMI